MIINTKLIENLIMNEAASAYALEKELGISRMMITNYRNGKSSIENLKLGNAMKIQEYINEGNYNISYDYEETIMEFEADYAYLDDVIIVVRETDDRIDYDVIVDYGNVEDINDIYKDDGLIYTLEKKDDVLSEMKEWNKIIK